MKHTRAGEPSPSGALSRQALFRQMRHTGMLDKEEDKGEAEIWIDLAGLAE